MEIEDETLSAAAHDNTNVLSARIYDVCVYANVNHLLSVFMVDHLQTKEFTDIDER